VAIRGTAAPGTNVNITEGFAARGAQRLTSTRFLVVGYFPWGPPNRPVTINGFREAETRLGGQHANSPAMEALRHYFVDFGGDEAVVVGVKGPAAARGTITVEDRGVDEAADDTLTIRKKYPTSVVDVYFTIEDGTDADTFKLTVWSEHLMRLGAKREVYNNLKMDAASIELVNQASDLVELVNAVSANAAPANLPLATAATLIPGGTDDYASINAASYIGAGAGENATGLQALNSEEYGPGQVAIPGLTTQAVHAALISHAETYHRLALLDLAAALDKDEAVDARLLLDSAYAALHWPRVQMQDDLTGLRKYFATSGLVAGSCAKAERTFGIGRAPAGSVGRIPRALDVERYANGQSQIDDATRAFLNIHEVNAIAPLPNQGIRIYGERVLKASGQVQMMHEVRVLNFLYYQLKRDLQEIPFETIDGQGRLFREAESVCRNRLRQLWNEGALFGETEEDAFRVVCDKTNNSAEDLDAQELTVDIEVKISPTAERVGVNVTKRSLTVDLRAGRVTT
jgi:phage tail sheath protein FI